MPRHWVVRTDVRVVKEVIVPSLDAGDLRQGWAYRDDQDLNIVGPALYDHGRDALNGHQKATWRRVQRFWPEHSNPVQPGDRIILPKVPGWGRWRLVEAVGGYRFERHPETGDHGHILRVKTLLPEISSSNAAVGAGLQRTMRSQGAMWNIDGLSEEVERLLAASADGDVAVADDATVRLKGVLDDTLSGLMQRLRRDFQANQLEEPVHRLLVQMFEGATVEKTAGAGEHGADFVIRECDRFDHEHTTVVQLKDYEEVLSGSRPLAQIREAHHWWAPVSAAVLLSTAAREDPTFAKARDELAEELGIPVTVVLGQQLASWFLANLEAVAAD
jgi:hypothetical protein